MDTKAAISVSRDGETTLLHLNLDSKTKEYETQGEFHLRLTPEDRRWLLTELVQTPSRS